jgi:hypothetical protein
MLVHNNDRSDIVNDMNQARDEKEELNMNESRIDEWKMVNRI